MPTHFFDSSAIVKHYYPEEKLVINVPETLEEVQKLIDDEIQESIYLDYKDSRALDPNKRQEIAKDVSAFANSDGGVVIYGIEEDNHLPVKVDDGVDHSKWSRERLEQIIRSNITPRIDDLQIIQIPISEERSIFVIHIPKSYRGPHQEINSKRYYKRFNFLSSAMEDYEINDVRARRRVIPPLLNVDTEIKHGVVVYLKVTNIGSLPAQDVTFAFSEALVWPNDKEVPTLFAWGAKVIAPGKIYSFYYHSFQELLKEGNEIPATFDVTVCYVHPEIGQRISDVFHVDLTDYLNSSLIESDIYEHSRTLKDVLDKLRAELEKMNKRFEQLSPISGATGLDLSISTLRNLRHVLHDDGQLEKLDPYACDAKVFEEVLGVDFGVASRLYSFFFTRRHQKSDERLSDIEGMTKELIEKFHEHFALDSNSD